MTRLQPTSRRPGLRACCLLLLALCAPCPTLASSGEPAPPCDTAADSAFARSLLGLGLQNISVNTIECWRTVAFENHHFRHSAAALGSIARFAGGPWIAVERRFGLGAAAVWDTGAGSPATIRYPGEHDFPPSPAGPLLADTRRGIELELRPLVTYEVGRIFDPVLLRVELQPTLRYNPWPGSRVTLGAVIPLRNDFETDPLHPDVDRVRPGPITLEQFAWVPGTILVSAAAGSFGGNRYGLSAGVARPFRQGAWLLDAQADMTGFVAYAGDHSEFSAPSRWTGFCGLTWRPPAYDLAVRARLARFLSRDRGAEFEVRRSLGDLDVAFFAQRTGGMRINGVRLTLPLPLAFRFPGTPSRVLPADRFSFEYRDLATAAGRYVLGVPAREEFLRQLSRPALAASADRYLAGHGVAAAQRSAGRTQWVAFGGMTGFADTPWCGVMEDRGAELGVNTVPKAAAYDHRGEYRNDVYYLDLGFLPRTEIGLRWTVIPGLKSFQDVVPDSKLTDSDRMLSGRFQVLAPRAGRPGLAVGVEDVSGTRRFHSTYAVAGLPWSHGTLYCRGAIGYAPAVLTAARHTLNGVFGAFECSPWWPVAVTFEYDTEKWNSSLGISPGLGLRARMALLGFRHTGFGGGWFHSL